MEARASGAVHGLDTENADKHGSDRAARIADEKSVLFAFSVSPSIGRTCERVLSDASLKRREVPERIRWLAACVRRGHQPRLSRQAQLNSPTSIGARIRLAVRLRLERPVG